MCLYFFSWLFGTWKRLLNKHTSIAVCLLYHKVVFSCSPKVAVKHRRFKAVIHDDNCLRCQRRMSCIEETLYYRIDLTVHVCWHVFNCGGSRLTYTSRCKQPLFGNIGYAYYYYSKSWIIKQVLINFVSKFLNLLTVYWNFVNISRQTKMEKKFVILLNKYPQTLVSLITR